MYRVLIADDNEASALTLGWLFEMMGHEFRVVSVAFDVHAAARAFKPDIIMLDIGMPGINGYDLCRLLRREPSFADTLFIAQTGWGLKEHLQMAKEAGFHHHLLKPIDMQALENVVGDLQRRKAA